MGICVRHWQWTVCRVVFLLNFYKISGISTTTKKKCIRSNSGRNPSRVNGFYTFSSTAAASSLIHVHYNARDRTTTTARLFEPGRVGLTSWAQVNFFQFFSSKKKKSIFTNLLQQINIYTSCIRFL